MTIIIPSNIFFLLLDLIHKILDESDTKKIKVVGILKMPATTPFFISTV